MQNYRGQIFIGRYRGNYRNKDFGRSKSRSREKQYSNNLEEMIKAVVDQDQV